MALKKRIYFSAGSGDWGSPMLDRLGTEQSKDYQADKSGTTFLIAHIINILAIIHRWKSMHSLWFKVWAQCPVSGNFQLFFLERQMRLVEWLWSKVMMRFALLCLVFHAVPEQRLKLLINLSHWGYRVSWQSVTHHRLTFQTWMTVVKLSLLRLRVSR